MSQPSSSSSNHQPFEPDQPFHIFNPNFDFDFDFDFNLDDYLSLDLDLDFVWDPSYTTADAPGTFDQGYPSANVCPTTERQEVIEQSSTTETRTLKDSRARLLPTPDFEIHPVLTEETDLGQDIDWDALLKAAPLDQDSLLPAHDDSTFWDSFDFDPNVSTDWPEDNPPLNAAPVPRQHSHSHSHSPPPPPPPPSIYPCHTKPCHQTFPTSAQQRQHSETAHRKSHHCLELDCGWSFLYAKDLRRHVRTKHSAEKMFWCPYEGCEYARIGFKREDNRDRHVDKQHLRKVTEEG